ncbi:MAG: PAS domain-containing protein [Kordiimonas sp.]
MPSIEKLSNAQEFLLKYWLKCGGLTSPKLPSRSDIDPPKVGRHMGWVVIFEKQENPIDFKYRLIGTEVTSLISMDYTGKSLSTIPGKGEGSRIWKFLTKTLEEQKPLLEVLPYVGPQEQVSHTTLLSLPLASDGIHPQMVLLTVDFVKWSFLDSNNTLDEKVVALRMFLENTAKAEQENSHT